MPIIKLKIRNLDRLRDRLNQFPAISGKHVSAAINKAVFAVEGKAKPITPVKGGRLVGSYTFGRIMSTAQTLLGRVKPNVFYAKFVSAKAQVGQRFKRPSKNRKAVGGFVEVGVRRARPEIERFFQQAADNIAQDITRGLR